MFVNKPKRQIYTDENKDTIFNNAKQQGWKKGLEELFPHSVTSQDCLS